MRTNPTVNKQKNGSISLKGFGAVKSEFSRFTSYIKDILNKNVIYVFHSEEKTDKDGNTQQRLMCEGATKNIVWTPCDFGGYVQMIGNRRVISFTPEQEFFAKGCHGIEGQMEIPAVGPMDKNDFLARLFDQAKKNIEAENQAFARLRPSMKRLLRRGRRSSDPLPMWIPPTLLSPGLKGYSTHFPPNGNLIWPSMPALRNWGCFMTGSWASTPPLLRR